MAIKLTAEQQAVVDSRGGELLVSAAAGSGKTRVLVERLVNRVEQEHLDLTQFLVITFTKAAAAELRSKILAELNRRLNEGEGEQRHLRRHDALALGDERALGAQAVLPAAVPLVALERRHHAVVAAARAFGRPRVLLRSPQQQRRRP